MAGLDIITEKQIETPSKEHVIPNFLGGSLQHPYLDKTTNDILGESIDASLQEALLPLLVLVDGRSHRSPGKKPPPLRNVSAEDGKTYDIEAGGIVRAQTQLKVSREGKLVTVHAVGADRAAIERPLRKYLKRLGKQKGQVDEQLAKLESEVRANTIPALRFSCNPWQPDPCRSMAKIAYNLLALANKGDVLQDAFRPIREYIWTGNQPAIPPVVPTILPEAPSTDQSSTRLDHLVVVRKEPGTGAVTGTVVMFGHIASSVMLAVTGPNLPDGFVRSYRVDQLSREHEIDDSADLAIQWPRHEQCLAIPDEARQAAAVGQIRRALKSALWVQRIHWCANTSFQELVQEQQRGRKVDTADLVALVAEKVTQALLPAIQSAAERRHREAREAFEREVAKDSSDEDDDC